MDKITKALHTKVNVDGSHAVVTPLFQASAFEADSPYFYSRKNNPNVDELEQVHAALEETKYALAVTTGMAAITLVLHLLKPGDTLIVNRDIYGCSYKLFQKFGEQWNIKIVILDLSIEENIGKIPADTRMIIFETPTNPFLKSISIQKVSDKLKSLNENGIIVVDNTWATPLFQLPVKCGADISLYSATKYFSGHSDVMGGLILCDNEKLHDRMRELRFYFGCNLDPNSAWLLRRSIQTLGIRMQDHEAKTKKVVSFLEKLPQVTKVYYPTVDGQQLKGYGALIFFHLREDLVAKYEIFRDQLSLFDSGTGMACVTSMVAQPYTGSHASMNDHEKLEMGLNKSLIRLSIGLENAEDLMNDLKKAFEKIDS